MLRCSLILFTASICFAAVRGTVVDPSGRPVSGATITCNGRTAETNVEGRFAIEDVDGCQARVEAADFETLHVALGSGPARIELSLARLAEIVVVSATRRESTLEEAGVSGTVYTRQDLELRQAPLVADVIRETPGLHVSRYGRPGSLTQIYTRGGQRTGALVIIDGVPINDPGGEVNLAGLGTTGLDRIEVVRGPESALFGAEASSGVIQLFTARGDPERTLPRGSISYERGSFATDRWTASLAGGTGSRADYALAAEQLHTTGEYANDWFRNTTGTANAGARLTEATSVRGVVRAFDAYAGVPNQVAYGIHDLDAREATRDYAAGFHLDDVRGRRFIQRVSASYHRSWDLFTDSLNDGPFNAAALVRDVNGGVYLERLGGGPVLPGTRLVEKSVTLWGWTPYLSLSSRKSAGYQGTVTHSGGAAVFGYEFERQRGDITGRDVARDNHGLFLHEQRAVAGRLFLSGGLRVERSSAFGAKIAPRGAASFLLSPSTSVRFGAGAGITEPSLLQNYANDPYYTGNTDLRPEKTTNFEAGIAREWFSRRLQTEVTAFSNSFRDLIVFHPMPWPEPATWRNIDASRARGIEASARARLPRAISIAGQYTRLWTRITESSVPDSPFTGLGRELARRPGNSGAVSVSIAPRRWSLDTGAVFVGERQDSDTVFGITRNPGYQSVYASGSVRLSRNFTPYVRVENLLNQRYQEVLGYPAQSRAVYGGLRLGW